MKISVIGTGYVGLVSGVCFSEIGHDVVCIDIDLKKVEMLNKAQNPIYEPGLTELLERNISENRLSFSNGFESVKESDAIFLAVGTPSSDDGTADLSYLFAALKDISPYLKEGAVLVIKSTVPVGTHQLVQSEIEAHTKVNVHVVNNPEFLKEGAAIDDFLRPDRVVVGHKSDVAKKVMEKIYSPLVLQGRPIYFMSNASAELSKYAANSFLAAKISFINEIAKLSEKVGADINEVRQGIISDKRIGPHFLYPGIGYGGSCFPKDVKALIQTGKNHGQSLYIVEAADKVNDLQKKFFLQKILSFYNNDFKDKVLCLWGVSFKPNTDDIREAPSLLVAKTIFEGGGKVHFFDPIAKNNFLNAFKEYEGKIESFDDKYSAAHKADGLVVLTEWGPNRSVDFDRLFKELKTPVIFDGRNIYSPKEVQSSKIKYFGIGRFLD